jgi:cytidylate kinase
MVGRDIGSVVMPNADFKIFLSVAPEERARRRYAELQRSGQAPDYDTVLHDLQRRDLLDQHNTLQATDAYILNNDGLAPAHVVEELIAVLQRHDEA